jgi:hypothetical protein
MHQQQQQLHDAACTHSWGRGLCQLDSPGLGLTGPLFIRYEVLARMLAVIMTRYGCEGKGGLALTCIAL